MLHCTCSGKCEGRSAKQRLYRKLCIPIPTVNSVSRQVFWLVPPLPHLPIPQRDSGTRGSFSRTYSCVNSPRIARDSLFAFGISAASDRSFGTLMHQDHNTHQM